MSRFWNDAQRILDTAIHGDADVGVLIDPSGAIRIVDAAGWRPEALQAHYGAQTVYQVTHSQSTVRVTGRSGNRSCIVEERRPSLPAGVPFSVRVWPEMMTN